MSIEKGLGGVSAAKYKRSKYALTAAVASLLIGRTGNAAVRTWIANSSNWNNSANWSTATVPVAGDVANIVNADGLNRLITYDYSTPAIALTTLDINLTGASGTSTDQLYMPNNYALSSANEFVGGYPGSTGNGVGMINQSAGTNTVTGELALGFNTGDKGTYLLSGGSLNAASTSLEYIGYAGAATFNQSGGTNTAGTFYLGFSSTSVSSYTMTLLSYLTISGSAYFGYTGSATMAETTNNCTLSIGGGCYLAFNPNSSANFNYGTGSASITGSQYVGNGGTAYLAEVAGGTVNIGGSENIGVNSGSIGTYNMTGGQTTVTGGLYLGSNAGSQGTLILGAGADFNASSAVVGGSANGPGGAGILTIGSQSAFGTTGSLTLYNTSGNALNLNGGTLNVGSLNLFGSQARFNWTSGTLNVSNGTIFVDGSATASGAIGATFNISAGKTLYAQSLAVGGDTAGVLTQTGGAVTTTVLTLGIGMSGTYYLSGGALNITGTQGTLYLGYNSPGLFVQNGGSLTANLLITNNFVSNLPSNFNLSAGVATFLQEADLDFGNNTINQTGGRFVVGSANQIANLNVGAMIASTTGYDIFALSGGLVTVNGSIAVGGAFASNVSANFITAGPGYTGIFNVSGTAQVSVTGALKIFNTPGTTLNFSGGSITAGSLDTSGLPSLFNWTAGTLSLTNTNLAFDSTAASNVAPFGSAFTLLNGQTLNVTQSETIGGTAGDSLTLNSGSVNNVAGGLILTPGGTLTLNAGSVLTAASINQSGGTISGNLTNTGSFIFQSGSFTGRLINQGTATLGSGFAPTNGIENDAVLNIPAGQTVTVNGSGIDNLGTFNLTNATLTGTAPVLNDYAGIMNASGTIQAPLTNDGTFNATGILTLAVSAANYGQFNVPAGSTVRSSTITNNGTITLSGGAITSAVTNTTAGIISGIGNLAGAFSNSGIIQVPATGTLNIANPWTNGGIVTLAGGPGVLGGGLITNTGTLQGAGEISAPVTNSTGTVRAQNGELDLAGSGDTNGAAGQIQAGVGSTVVFVQGLQANAGTIAISGGTIDNNNQPLTNSGMIEGSGSFRAGSWINTAAAQMNFTGTSNVFGPVTNAGAIHLYGNSITFFGNITSTGFVQLSNATVYYLGSNGANIGGSYISDPSSSYFNGLSITYSGSVTGGTGDGYFLVNGSTLTNTGTFNNQGSLTATAVNNSGSFTQTGTLTQAGNFNNSGSVTLSGVQHWSAGTSFNNTAGAATFQSDTGSSSSSPLTVNVSGGTVTFAASQHLAALSVSSGATANVSNTAGLRTVVFAPSISVAGVLNLQTNDLDEQAGNLPAVTALVKQGLSFGSGITSSSAAGDTTHLTTLGVLLNSDGSGHPLYGSAAPLGAFDGSYPAVNDVLVKYTYYGDANLDGKVDGSDYSRIDSGFITRATGWSNGDFNYDGVINGSDYTLIDNAFNSQGSALTAGADASVALEISQETSVPEPTATAFCVATPALLGRRRK